MRGMGLIVLPVPLHRLVVRCGLVQGEVVVSVRPTLPVVGLDSILGSDLADSHVWAEGPPSPIVTSSPSFTGQSDESAQCFPGVFTVCAVMWSM